MRILQDGDWSSSWESEFLFDYLFEGIPIDSLSDDILPLNGDIIAYKSMNNATCSKVRDHIKNRDGVPYNLIHCSNEWGYSSYPSIVSGQLKGDFYKEYQDASHVFRQYWQPLSDYGNVTTIPLGCKKGFLGSRKIQEKEFDFSFIGSLKVDRPKVVDIINGYKSFIHITDGWNAKNSLSVEDQVDIYSKTILCPCPTGGSHPDSFRICEVFESGSIPIICNYYGFDYNFKVFGYNPIPKIDSWDYLPTALSKIKDYGVESYTEQLLGWYERWKRGFKSECRKSLEHR